MENVLVIVSIIVGMCGIAGFVLSIINTIRQKYELELQKQELARNNRLMFLADRIFDSSIPRELRQPFYEEYISMKGNGTAVRFWLLEGEREKKEQLAAHSAATPQRAERSALTL
jgi:hypothetical protein